MELVGSDDDHIESFTFARSPRYEQLSIRPPPPRGTVLSDEKHGDLSRSLEFKCMQFASLGCGFDLSSPKDEHLY